jgi:hypothetical protein
MNKQNVLGIVISLVLMVIAVLTAYGKVYSYVQKNYVHKEVMELVLSRLDRIERKVDLLLQDKTRQ